MQLATIGTKYQVVIPKNVRRKSKTVRPGNQVAVDVDKNGVITMRPLTKSWVERTRGMMAEAWKDIDTDKYLQDMRDEWDRKPQE